MLFDRRILKVANINAKAESIENKPAFREAFQTAKALPVYLQQPTYLQTAGTAGQCQLPTSGKTRDFIDFAFFNYLIRAGAAVAGYADPEASGFPVQLAPGYIGVD